MSGRLRCAGIVLSGFIGVIPCGCDPDSVSPGSTLMINPASDEAGGLTAMRAAAARGRWDRVYELTPVTLVGRPGDVEVIRLGIRAAMERQDIDRAGELTLALVEASDAADAVVIQEASEVLIRTGRLVEGLDVLESGLTHHPDRHDWRRIVADSRAMLEQFSDAGRHGRRLIRDRRFDRELLMLMLPHDQRQLEHQTLEHLQSLNPADGRLGIWEARRALDDGNFDRAAKVAASIAVRHRTFSPALRLWIESIDRSAVGEDDPGLISLRRHLRSLGVEDWRALCDDGYLVTALAAHFSDRLAIARRLAASVLRREPFHREAWAVWSADDADRRREATRRIAAINGIAEAATRLQRGIGDRAVAMLDVAEAQRAIGCPWSAEAWASLAAAASSPGGTGLTDATGPSDPDGPANIDDPPNAAGRAARFRASVVRYLRTDSPWVSAELIGSLQTGGVAAAEDTNLFADLRRILAEQGGTDDGPPTGGGGGWTGLVEGTGGEVLLRNVAPEIGLDHDGRPASDLDTAGVPISRSLGCGAAVVDFDLDGWPDLYLADGDGDELGVANDPNRLWHNRDGRFADVSSASGADDRGFGIGVTAADLNADGHPDLISTNYGPDRVWINRTDGTFVDRTDRYFGVDEPRDDAAPWSTSVAAADWDGDTLPEIWVLKYCGGTEPITERCGDDAVARSCAPVHFRAAGDVVFRSRRDPATPPRRLNLPGPAMTGRGLGILIGPLADDDALSVLVANDMTTNHLWRPGDDGPVETAVAAGIAGTPRAPNQGSMGIAQGDADGDGRPDVLITNFLREPNAFHFTAGDRFVERGGQTGVHGPSFLKVGFGVQAVDLSGDGVDEWVVANGNIDQGDDGLYEQPFEVFRVVGGRLDVATFDDGSDPSRYLRRAHVGRTLVRIDYDRDRRDDLVVTHQTEPVALLASGGTTPASSLRIALVGDDDSPREPIGAEVSVRWPDRTETRWLMAGDGYLCRNEPTLRFASAEAVERVDVTVRWIDGKVDLFEGLPCGTDWLMVRGRRPWRFE